MTYRVALARLILRHCRSLPILGEQVNAKRRPAHVSAQEIGAL